MRITALQLPYPKAKTHQSAKAYQDEILHRLKTIDPDTTELIVLPAYVNAPGILDSNLLSDFVKTNGENLIQEIAFQANRLKSLICVGTLYQESISQWVNRTWLFGQNGKPITWYDKIHLTNREKELGLIAGSEPVIAEHNGVRFGFAVCSDLYFPAYFNALAMQNVDIILSPVSHRSEPVERIRIMCQCRSLDTDSYIIRSGYAADTERQEGNSLVASPEGTILADIEFGPGLLNLDISSNINSREPSLHGPDLVDSKHLFNFYPSYIGQEKTITNSTLPHLCAHRGVSHACPENTLPAFGAAIAMGVQEIELDLWMSADGIPIVCHDSSVDRTTNGEGIIAEMTWANIQSLDAGITLGSEWSGVRIPRFEDILNIVDGRLSINIHIKEPGFDGQLVKLVCDLLYEQGLPQMHYIAGDEDVLEVALDHAPEIPRACLAAQKVPDHMVTVAEKFACNRVQFGRNVTPKALKKAHELGLICNLFWSDELNDARSYLSMGINVVLTNAAHKLLPLISKSAG